MVSGCQRTSESNLVVGFGTPTTGHRLRLHAISRQVLRRVRSGRRLVLVVDGGRWAWLTVMFVMRGLEVGMQLVTSEENSICDNDSEGR